MKRIMIVLLALWMLTLCACRKIEKPEPTAKDTTDPVTTAATDTTEAGPPLSYPTDKETSADGADPDDATAAAVRITEDEAVAAARNYLGETDPDTGYRYSFTYQDLYLDTDTGIEYHRIRVSWYLEEDDRYSTCGYLLVALDGASVQKFDW